MLSLGKLQIWIAGTMERDASWGAKPGQSIRNGLDCSIYHEISIAYVLLQSFIRGN